MKTVREILGGRRPYWVAASWPVRRVVEYLCEKHVGAVPVVEADVVVGVFSERDLMRRVVLPGLDLDVAGIAEVMTPEVIYVEPDESYLAAKELMLKQNIRHLVVKDAQGELSGFVSLRELSETALEEATSLITKLNDQYYRTPG
ncbi:MAG: CBS domain-containing protein [Candidatus Hydrogenedentes bacterium]|nr:CBS domain-containing protein [Candidatus Hydrogenedentota bacterium]